MASARDWILVLFGRFVRARGGWISVAQLIELLDPLGSDSASTRAAISRMKRSGFVTASVRDGVSGYELTRDGEEFFADGDQRVLERTESDGRWVLASFSVPESQRNTRYKIRSLLLDLGFGQESAGMLLAPSGLAGEAERSLRRDGLNEWVSLWLAEFGALGTIENVASSAWDLGALASSYKRYITHAEAALKVEDSEPTNAFVRYMGCINEWRELSYLDPGLPLDAVPEGWPKVRAQKLFEHVETALLPLAQNHVDSTAAASKRPKTKVIA